MKDKVTSFETSKRLAELGLECECNAGWWCFCYEHLDKPRVSVFFFEDVNRFSHNEMQSVNKATGMKEDYSSPSIKAYDCHDLLMWLRDNTNLEISNVLGLSLGRVWEVTINPSNDQTISCAEQPQEALAQTVIKILEGKVEK